MSDTVKLIIEISKDVYTRLYDNGIQDNEIAVNDVCEMARALRIGTPLPKGHGDLKDVEKLKTAFIASSAAVRGNFTDADVASIIYNSPTIIKADKAENEEV